MSSRAEPIEKTEKKTRARLPAQLPASRVSRNPNGNYRLERVDAVSGQEDERQRADKRVSTTESQM